MILLTGATGSIGGHLVRQLRAEGVPFTAFVRDAAKGRELGCDFVVGDFDAPDSVASAMRGVDRVFLNGAGAVPTDGEQPMVRQQRTVIDAARAAGVERVVKVSVWHARPEGRLAQAAHWAIEEYLRASGLTWSLLQPSGFMQNFATGAGTFRQDGSLIAAEPDAPVSYVDCQDIAACAAALLTSVDGAGRTFVPTGPEALTMREVAEQLADTLGRPVRTVALHPEAMAAQLKEQGLPAQFSDDVAFLWGEVGQGTLSATTTAVADLTGRKPRTLREFLADNREAFA
ncbi:MAG: SDR family oxidoreductase [Streptomycetaceae bacterium]|nr:SDR family oxidoreductase [Streptomycetaceae bacterium]